LRLLLEQPWKVVVILSKLAGGVVHSDGNELEIISSWVDLLNQSWKNLAELYASFAPFGSK
jgi:hypothetical protein